MGEGALKTPSPKSDMECDNCKINQYEVRYSSTDDKWLCKECFVEPISDCGASPYLVEKETLPSGRQVSKARLDELNRRVVLNYNPKDGSYKVGRLGENGKIQHRQPDYRP